MPRPSFHVFDRKITPNDVAVNRVYALLSPQEASLLLDLVDAATIDAAATEVDEASLVARLTAAAEGRAPLQSGEQAYYE